MRRIIMRAATAALCASLLVPMAVAAKPPTPTSSAAACRLNGTTVRVSVTWANLSVTGGQFFINTEPLGGTHTVVWDQKGKRGTHVEDMDIGTGPADIVTVNLYNDRVPGILVAQHEIGEGNNAEEIAAC